jgi:hypothetical protein
MYDISCGVGKACGREAGARVPTMPVTIVATPWWARRSIVRAVRPTPGPRLCPPYSRVVE